LGQRKPNIKALVRREDIDGLERAASYQDVKPTSQGTVSDFGIPVRAEAILALGTLDASSGGPTLARALRDPADAVRCAAVRALRARQEVDLLVQALRWVPPDGNSPKLVLRALYDLQEFVSAPMIAEALIHRPDEELLGEDGAELILTLLEDDRAETTNELMKLLVEALGDERGIVVDRAGELLILLAPNSIDAVAAELRTGAAPAEAAYVLGRIADSKALKPLLGGLRHRDARVRAESASALAELEHPAAVEPLLGAGRDTDHSVRNQARIALDRMGNTAVIVGVAALVQPIIREAVRSAIEHQQDKEDDRKHPPGPAARRQRRSPRSNGGPPKPAEPRPEAEEAERRTQ
jgi:HEAT repeat protein